ncbi:hypothetical protein DM02DRAFT_507661, partial [Periconia macrospinosa]
DSRERAEERQSYVSFGEDGTTVSINSYGHIMQISRFLGYGRSGFFCADSENISEPYYVQSRMEELMDLAQNPSEGIGLDFQDLVYSDKDKPSVEFIYDRWPRFELPNANIPKMSIQYFCNQGTVFQKYVLAFDKDTILPEALNRVRMDAKILIRNLDFVWNDTKFNESNQTVDRRSGPNHRSLIILHRITPGMVEQMGIEISKYVQGAGPKAAALIITPFAGGVAQTVRDHEGDWYIELSKEVKDNFIKSGRIDISMGYRLQLLEENQKWINSTVPAAHLKHMSELFSSNKSFRKIRFSQHKQLDFIIRRNLEHILSVCCIPVPQSPILGNPEDTKDSDPSEVAITCGDISAHRVGPRAKRNEAQITPLEEPNEAQTPSPVLEDLKSMIRPWISKLDKSNDRGNYAFVQKFDKDASNHGFIEERTVQTDMKFGLADHVLICLAIKCVEDLGLDDTICLTHEEELNRDEQEDEYFILNQYSYKEVRRNVLKRFTAEGPLSKQRMLATCRTPGESRFLFHSKDTILFHIMNARFFQENTEDSKRNGKDKRLRESEEFWKYADDRWKNTVDAQAYHDEYQDLLWEKPLFHALIFILWCQRRGVNKSSFEEIFRSITKIFLERISWSGLLPGLLDEDQEPIPHRNEMDRDSYWHATFEIPYILWTYGRDNFDAQSSRKKGNQTTKDASNNPPGPQQAPRTSNLGDNTAGNLISLREATRTGQLSTKTVPFVNFNTLVDQKGIVEVADDWLQSGPAALDFSFKPRFEESKIAEELDSVQSLIKAEKGEFESERVIALDIESYRSREDFLRTSGIKGAVIDIGKGSSGEEIFERTQDTNGEILKSLEKRRTVQTAKKRIIWLPNGDKGTALLCCLASPELERDKMLHFLSRHAFHDKYFFDGATAALNEWETELHLSFFRCFKYSCEENTKLFLKDNGNGISNTSFVKIGARDGGLTTESIFLSQATMSFRFVGDFFDRFWTCHFLEHYRKECRDRLSKLSHTIHKSTGDPGQKKNPWQQRKVLELLLYNEMLEKIYDSTKEILDWVKVNLLDAGSLVDASFPLNPLAEAVRGGIQLLRQGTSENYFHIIENWRLFEQILQAIEDDLSGNIERMDQWSRREEERESERPRWTRKDEKRYRAAIIKITVLNQRKARDIVRLRASIKAFRESLPGRLESIRNDISFRGSENINLFTYVTVVFLPLGFATGVFSMSGPPNRQTLERMVVLAFIAIGLTIFALANAKTTGKAVVRPII